jgi:hypothetical protein
MAKRLFLHIGAMKSGTTYVQALGTANDARLETAGVRWVPGTSREDAAADVVLRTGRKPPTVDAMCERLRRAADGWDGDLFLSMELLSRQGPPVQQRLVAAADVGEVHVIVSGRDLARVIPSRWLTTVRNRQAWTWTEYVQAVCSEDPPTTRAGRNFWVFQDLAWMLRSWSGVAAPDRMHVVTVPATSTDPRLIWRRFAEVLGIDPEGYQEPTPQKANASSSVVTAEVLRRVNQRVEDLSNPIYRRGIGDLVERVYSSRPADEPRLQIPADYRDWIERRARRMNDEITELGVNVIGDLAELLPGPGDPDAVDSVEVGDAQLLEAAIDGLAGMGRIMATARLENETLRHQYGLPPAELVGMHGPPPRRRRRRRRLVRSFVRRIRTVPWR